jgi:metal-responsive CopG/Arc/MetJ family transcriptional regulator
MTTQINLRFPDELLVNAKDYAQNHGYLNIQEFIRDAIREKVYEDMEVRDDYLSRLQSKEATTFISDKEADELDRQLEKQANLE